VSAERVLVNFFYAHPVGHAIEGLHYALGHHAADPSREIAIALSARTPVQIADWCPFVSAAYAIDHPFLEPATDSAAVLAGVPREWDWVLDDVRSRLDAQLDLFPGMRAYYAASAALLVARRGRSVAGGPDAGYVPHQRLRLALPPPARAAAAGRVRRADGGPWIALMPAGSSERALYPSVASWRLVLDGLRAALPDVRIALVGKLRRDERSATSLDVGEHAALLAHPAVAADAFDLDLAEQLAIVEACDVFLAPHTGFGLAALAVGTPWLALSGGRWFEYFFNGVPFRSVIPDTRRYPCFSQFEAPAVADDEDGPRVPSMSRARIRDDRDAIVAAAVELCAGAMTYEDALADYFRALLRAHGGDPSAIWSIDGVHTRYV